MSLVDCFHLQSSTELYFVVPSEVTQTVNWGRNPSEIVELEGW